MAPPPQVTSSNESDSDDPTEERDNEHGDSDDSMFERWQPTAEKRSQPDSIRPSMEEPVAKRQRLDSREGGSEAPLDKAVDNEGDDLLTNRTRHSSVSSNAGSVQSDVSESDGFLALPESSYDMFRYREI